MDAFDEEYNVIYNIMDIRFLSIEHQLDELVDSFMSHITDPKNGIENVKISKKSLVLKGHVGVIYFLNNEFVDIKSTCPIEDRQKNDLQFFSGSAGRRVHDMMELNRLILYFNPNVEEIQKEIYNRQVVYRNGFLYVLGCNIFHRRVLPDYVLRIYSQECQSPELVEIYDTKFTCNFIAVDDSRVYFCNSSGIDRIYDFSLKEFIYHPVKLHCFYAVFVTHKFIIFQTRLDFLFYDKTTFFFSHKIRHAPSPRTKITKCTMINNSFFIIVHFVNHLKIQYRLISLEGEIKDKVIKFDEPLTFCMVNKWFKGNLVFFIERDAIWLTNDKDKLLKIEF